ncbi:hypothetical protein [Xanthomonas pisi]|uniref:hypothetical protein n=1 Tax=Xanthomonas pisi TaxID=56457 RepID=UPI0011B0316A|nr:hypothetical protein [Xanthomonas pisi]
MSAPEDPRICQKCLSNAHVREKSLLIGAASPRKIFGSVEDRAGYQRKDQLAIDECKTEFLQEGHIQQFIDGYYCGECGIGFVPSSIANGPIWPQIT